MCATKSPPADHDRFIAAYKSAAADLQASEHCLGYEMAQGDEEPNHFIIRIEWDSREGARSWFS